LQVLHNIQMNPSKKARTLLFERLSLSLPFRFSSVDGEHWRWNNNCQSGIQESWRCN